MNKILKKLVYLLLILFSLNLNANSDEKIKIGILIPITGEDKKLGQLIIKATRMAIKDINDDRLEIYPKDTNSNPKQTLKSAIQFKEMGIDIVIGPIFYKNLAYLNEVENITFLSLTNKTINLPKNIISTGINATSQINTIKKFLKLKEINKTIFLIPNVDYEPEVKKAIKQSKIKISKHYIYETEPTKLTKQIEEITNYNIRKQNLADEISRVEGSDLTETEKERRINKLEKKYTLGKVNFDSVIISDFDESLKSVVTSLLYTDILPKNKYIITFNQWFDESLLDETNLQPMYYPSINKKNLEIFEKKFNNEFDEKPNHLALLSYDLVALVYYLSLKKNLSEINKLFNDKNSFKGKIGVFDIENNKINHRLNFYKIDNKEIKEIF
ncbi:ABC transporter substrate-binding protein [Pelagibacterales bacterium SAG-MED47]|nr:ABC transporter substrate-binding protein [Pelagibacterales bacterium SAG-MED47]